MDGVSLRYVRDVSELGKPDLIFLPGTKNTMDDLVWMRESGMETAVLRCSGDGIPVVGICGGYQMLGDALEDPDMWSMAEPMRGHGPLTHKDRIFPGEDPDPDSGPYQKRGAAFGICRKRSAGL